MDVYDPTAVENEDEEDTFGREGHEQLQEYIIFLVEASPSMQQPACGDLPQEYKGKTWLQIALMTFEGFLRARIISNANDQLAIVFYGTRESHNAHDFSNIYTFQDLDSPDATRIRCVQDLIGNPERDFTVQIGGCQERKPDHFKDGLFTVAAMLANLKTKTAAKSMYIMTNDPNPASSSSSLRQQAMQRAHELKEAGTLIDLYPMTPPDEDFDMAFWSKVLEQPDADPWEDDNNVERLQNLQSLTRSKAFRKRTICSLRWHLGSELQIAVQLYAMIMPATTSKSVWLEAENNQPLVHSTAQVCNDTGDILTDISKYRFPKPDVAEKSRLPPVLLDADTLKQLKFCMSPGLRLLGFKPVTALEAYHQLRPPAFVYPDERSLPGSAVAFIALHARLLARKMFALCSFVRSRVAEPRLAALLPQEEEIDDAGCQLSPPGFNLLYLPFADDLRHPETDPSFTGTSYPQASQIQISKAAAMIHALKLDSDVLAVNNPRIQRHFQVLEALALDEPVPEQVLDETMPDEEGQESIRPQVLAFRDSVYGPDHDEVGKIAARTPKRKAPEPENAAAVASRDWKALAQSGKLSTLKVPDLKEYLEAHSLPKSGNKTAIIERIENHLANQDAQ
ncbi:hypothetical protein WJX74_000326 [Apatococcus lobatus]|uniref:SAP domain-containing protein n=1 Tax=Apatococcus lobatus TaxID=904363 RepID=A0AAW1RIM4_9CHLO